MNSDRPLRVGLIGVNTSHASAFARVINANGFAAARLTWVWGGAVRADQPDASTLAEAFGIERIATMPNEFIQDTDLVLIVDDTGGGASHFGLAKPFIEAGVPTFIDKPMTVDLDQAFAIFDLAAAFGTPVMSSSALRHSGELAGAMPQIRSLGDVSTVVCVGPGDWYYYGIHTVELLVAAIGSGVAEVRQFSEPDRDITTLRFDRPGPTAVILTLRDAHPTFGLTVYGAHDVVRVDVRSADTMYRNQMADALRMAETRTAPLAASETLEILGILHAGRQSAQGGGEAVELAEVLGLAAR